MSIASVVGKPIAIDKATQDRTRPSTARVKILINLLDKHPKIVKLKIVDKKSGRIVKYDQRIVFDNLPKYCTCCHHQGHDVYSCRRRLDEENEQGNQRIESEKQKSLGKLDETLPKQFQGDTRELLNRIRKAQGKDAHKQGHQINAVWKQKSAAVMQQSMAEASELGRESVEAKEFAEQQKNEKAVNFSDIQHGTVQCTHEIQNLDSSTDNFQARANDAFIEKKSSGENIQKNLQPEEEVITDEIHINETLSDQDHKNADASKSVYSNEKLATEKGKKSMSPVSFKPISMKEFKLSIVNSSYAKGSVSGTKYENVQQFSFDQTGHVISGKAVFLKNRSSDKIPNEVVSAWPSKRNGWNKSQLQADNLFDQSRGYFHVAEVLPKPGSELSFLKKSPSTVTSKVTAAYEDNGVGRQSAAMVSQQVISGNMQHISEQNDQLDQNTEKIQSRCNNDNVNKDTEIEGSKYDHSQQQLYDQTGQCFSGKVNFLIKQNSDNIPTAFGSAWFSKHNGWNKSMQSSIQAVIECHRMGSEGHQYKDSRNEVIQSTREGSQCVYHQNVSVTAEKPIEQQQSQSNAAMSDFQCLQSGEDFNPNQEQSNPNTLLIEEKEDIQCEKIQNQMQVLEEGLKSDFKHSAKIDLLAENVDQSVDKRAISESDGQNHFDDQQIATTSDSSKTNTEKTVQKNNNQIVTSSSKTVVVMEKMENLNGNKIGGVIKKVNSITPMSISSAYSGEDIIDNEDISSFEETSNHVIISTMKESVIKSKLWDQRPFDDDESWDKGSGGGSSTEEENQQEGYSSGEESDTMTKPSAHQSQIKRNRISKPVASASVLNHNAPIFIPNKSTTAYPLMEPQTSITQKEQEQNVIISSADKSTTEYGSKNCIFSENKAITVSHQSLGMFISSEQSPIQNVTEGRHIYEEGEEEDILTQCRINAARRGDLSPMHSNPNKKNHRRERSWDDRLVEQAVVRKLPMRMAKQKHAVVKPKK